MDVESVVEGINQTIVSGKMSHDPQLDLGVVCRHQHHALRGNESLANTTAFLCPDGNVLQIGVRAGQATGRRHRLMV